MFVLFIYNQLLYLHCLLKGLKIDVPVLPGSLKLQFSEIISLLASKWVKINSGVANDAFV